MQPLITTDLFQPSAVVVAGVQLAETITKLEASGNWQPVTKKA